VKRLAIIRVISPVVKNELLIALPQLARPSAEMTAVCLLSYAIACVNLCPSAMPPPIWSSSNIPSMSLSQISPPERSVGALVRSHRAQQYRRSNIDHKQSPSFVHVLVLFIIYKSKLIISIDVLRVRLSATITCFDCVFNRDISCRSRL
jgi:hypothetical protein